MRIGAATTPSSWLLPNGLRPGQIFVFSHTYNSQCLTRYSVDGVGTVAAFTPPARLTGSSRASGEHQQV